jgi:hypothetical protein
MNEKVNIHIKFSGFVGFDMNKDDCFLEIWVSQKDKGLPLLSQTILKEENSERSGLQ